MMFGTHFRIIFELFMFFDTFHFYFNGKLNIIIKRV